MGVDLNSKTPISMNIQIRTLILITITTVFAAMARSAESDEEIIQSTIELARSYIGPDDKLDAINSVHYKGSLLYSSGDLGTIEMVYQKPMETTGETIYMGSWPEETVDRNLHVPPETFGDHWGMHFASP